MARKTRKYPRVRTNKLVASIDGGAARFTGCVVQNLSLGGMLVRTGDGIPDGSPVSVELVGPGMKKGLRIPGIVVGFDSGIRGIRLQFQLEGGEPQSRLVALLEAQGLKNPGEAPAPKAHAAPSRATEVDPPPLPRVPPVLTAPAANTSPPPLEVRAPAEKARRPPAPTATSATPTPAQQSATTVTAVEVPTAAPPSGGGALHDLEETNRRLMVQVKGLLLQLSEAESRVASQQQEIEQLRAELAVGTKGQAVR